MKLVEITEMVVKASGDSKGSRMLIEHLYLEEKCLIIGKTRFVVRISSLSFVLLNEICKHESERVEYRDCISRKLSKENSE